MAQVHTAEVRWDRDTEPSLPGDHPGEVDFDVQVFSMTGTRGRTRRSAKERTSSRSCALE
jgi:hypothetical protein